jgi:hypothetical protein
MAGDASVVGLTAVIRNQARVFVVTNDFSITIAAGARSALTNIPGVLFNSICIVGVAVVSEANTDWRIKFYKKDTGIVSAYNSDTYIGDVEVASLSETAGAYFEGSVEASLFYWDADMTNEIHVIAENIGAVNTSKLVLNILYTEAD